jgi:hypothetical protein
MNRKVLYCTVTGALALAIACSKSSQTPTSPTATTQPDAGAAADGSTLKVPAPGTTSPTGGTQIADPATLVAAAVSGKYASVALSYHFQVRSGTTVVSEGVVAGSGPSVSFQPPGLLSDTSYTWRVQATSQGSRGPWSADASFKSPVGAYLKTGELRDPLSIGRTVGQPNGSVTFTSEGASINDQSSNIMYVMGSPITAGEFSFLAKNIKNAAPGGKSKMLAIQQGTGDITDNPYRFTMEKRGSGYSDPGQTRYRIITNGSVFDSPSTTPNYDVNRWYFWQATWGNGQSRLMVRADSETGPVVVNLSTGTGSKPYAPNPMVAYVGAPVGRAGPDDASVPRIIVKNVWLSSSPRPSFPTIAEK